MAKASVSSALGGPAVKKGRPLLGTKARQLIAIRIDPDVLRALKRDATRQGIGYQTLINEILARHAKRRAPATPRREA